MAPEGIPPRRSWDERLEQEDYEYECRKFRICIIGKAGVGKTTLLSKVFGIDEEEAGVVRQDQAIRYGSGRHNIYDAIIDENRNSALIIHDSRGFESGEEGNLETVKTFIDYRSSKPSLPEQLHCIWYCISLEDVRQLHRAEHALFRFLRGKEIPLVFVLTKYDALVRHKVSEAIEDLEDATADDWLAGRHAANDHITVLRGILENAMGYGVKVQEVSNKRKDERLVQKLVAETTAIVKPNLRAVWIRAQGVLANQKRVACVDSFPTKVLSSLIIAAQLPFNPFRGVKLGEFFERTFHHCMTVWNLPGQSILFTKDFVQQSFREASQSYITVTTVGALIDIVGFLDAPLYVTLAVKIACDLIMIFQQLFWATPRRQKLSSKDLERELKCYKNSSVRASIHRLVEGHINYVNSCSVQKLVAVLGKVVEDGHRLVHNEASKSHKDLVSIEEPPFPELPGSSA